MTHTLLCLTLVAVMGADPAPTKDTRKPNPFAPSLPLLTDDEEEALDRIIDRFIEYDAAEATGPDAKKARLEFDKLGPDATFALIRGLNKAAELNDSCPALVIARKLGKILAATDDPELLQFAIENVGLGIKQSRHAGVIKDLKFACTLRKNALARAGTGTGAGGPKSLASMSVDDLAQAASKERGQALRGIFTELGKRKSDDAVAVLATAAAESSDSDTRQLARDQLVANLSALKADALKDKLKDDRAEVRVAAAQAAGKSLALGGELIDLLGDSEGRVKDAAHAALVKLNRGTDLGPADQADAVKKWKAWWAKQGGR